MVKAKTTQLQPEESCCPGSEFDAAAAQIGSRGGRLLAGPLDIPAGRIAVAMDPQGAVFASFEGEVD